MTFPKTATIVLLVSLGVMLSAFKCNTTAGTATGTACKAAITGHGEAVANEQLARFRAKEDWRKIVRATYGNAYDTWSKAQNIATPCTKQGSFPKTDLCDATADPCP